ncbi:MAG: phosphoglucosamine mutase [Actinobacteria bacterium]|nr:phosphoglucosamine mutase [Actinomycetota bacterium]
MSQLIISVSGVRGTIGQYLNNSVAERFGRAYASMIGKSKCVVLARDSRPSGAQLAGSVSAALSEMGLDVVDLGVVSTPGAALMTTKLKADGAIVITASHNPSQWNGLKFLGPDGLGVSAEDMASIGEKFRNKEFQPGKAERTGQIREDQSTHEIHVGEVLGRADVEAVSKKKFRVVLDSVNGAGGAGGKLLLEKMGCEVIHINAEANGEFAHSPEPIAENLTGLCEAVIENKADLGFAQDPDADRLAIVNELGQFIGEEYTLAMAVMAVLAKNKGPIATNLSTSRMIDDLAGRFGVEVFRTPVGEAHVARAIREHKCVVGGEGNGGVIDPNVVTVRDSFSGMSLVLQLMAGSEKTISQLVTDIPKYQMLKTKFDCEPGRAKKILEAVGQKFADQRLNRSDGIRVDWPEGWVHVRSSNTEPIMRVFAEAGEKSVAEELLERITEISKIK